MGFINYGAIYRPEGRNLELDFNECKEMKGTFLGRLDPTWIAGIHLKGALSPLYHKDEYESILKSNRGKSPILKNYVPQDTDYYHIFVSPNVTVVEQVRRFITKVNRPN